MFINNKNILFWAYFTTGTRTFPKSKLYLKLVCSLVTFYLSWSYYLVLHTNQDHRQNFQPMATILDSAEWKIIPKPKQTKGYSIWK